MLDILYSVMDLVCISILLIIILNLHSTPNKNSTLRYNLLLNYLILSVIVIDFLWGLFASGVFEYNRLLIYILIMLMCFALALIAFFWFFFVEYSIKNSYAFPRPVRIITYCLLLINLILVFSNPWTNIVFVLKNEVYFVPAWHWSIFQLFQLFFYVSSFIVAIVVYIRDRTLPNRKKMGSIIGFSIIPIFGCLLKYKYQNIPLLSISYLLSTCLIFVFTMSREKEHLNILLHETETLSKLDQSEQIIRAFTDSYECLYLFSMQGGAPYILKNSPRIQVIYDSIEDKKQSFFEIMRATVNPHYLDSMLMFVDMHSLEQRLEGKRMISQEFLGVQDEWCTASWIRVEYDEEGFINTVIFGIRNIDAEKRKEIEVEEKLKKALQNQNEIYAEILQMQSNGTLVTDMHNNVLMANDALKHFFNLTDYDVKNTPLSEFQKRFLGDQEAALKKKLHTIKVKGGHFAFEMIVNHPDFGELFLNVDSKLVKTSLGDKILITTFTDITKNKKVEKDLVLLSETDSLTGINNRGSGARKIEYLFSLEKQGMLCLMDADKFKSINDSYGHIAGDKVIIAIADCMKRAFRDKDVIMRLGGDEFAMYAVGITDEHTGSACIQRFFDEIKKAKITEIDGNEIQISLGAVFCNDLENNTFDDYYQMADRAMYKSKEFPGTHFEFYSQV